MTSATLGEAENTRRPIGIFPLRIEWTVELGSLPTAPPVRDDTRLFLPLDDGRVVAHGLAGGEPLWSAAVDSTTALATGEGLVFAGHSDGVAAVDAATGQLRWQAALGALAAPPLWQAGWLVAGTTSGRVVALRARDGSLVWTLPVGVPLAARPTIEADRLYLPLVDGRVLAVQIERATPLWERMVGGRPGGVLATPARVYVGSADKFLYALSARDGFLEWRWRAGADIVGSPAMDTSRVYFASLDNMVRALDRSSGVQRWRRGLGTRPQGGPQLAGDVVLVSGQAPEFRAFWTDTGRPAGQFVAPSDLLAPPLVVGGRNFVLVTSTLGGFAQLHRLGPARDPALEPLVALPGCLLPDEPAPTPAKAGSDAPVASGADMSASLTVATDCRRSPASSSDGLRPAWPPPETPRRPPGSPGAS